MNIISAQEFEQAKKDRDLKLKEQAKVVVLEACRSALNVFSLDVKLIIADIKFPLDDKERKEIVSIVKGVIPSINADLKSKGWLLKTQSTNGYDFFAVLSKLE